FHGSQSITIATIHHLLANPLTHIGAFAEAKQNERKAYNIYRTKFGPDHARTVQSYKNMRTKLTMAWYSFQLCNAFADTNAVIAITVDGTLKVCLIDTIIEIKELTDLFRSSSPFSLTSESFADFSLALVVHRDSW
uniref:Uncharacterized protein n=1 Tax=Amphimedon queenslandica TaxID=400682 RepID=A0A1X7SVA7_AMPQE